MVACLALSENGSVAGHLLHLQRGGSPRHIVSALAYKSWNQRVEIFAGAHVMMTCSSGDLNQSEYIRSFEARCGRKTDKT